MSDKEIEVAITSLNELKEDASIPKNVRLKIDNAISLLSQKSEMHIRISKALSELEDITEDANLQPYTRTQVWDTISLLEKIK